MGESLKRELVSCIKSLNLMEVLVFGVGFIKEELVFFRTLSNILGGFFAEIVFGCKPLTLFVKGYNLNV